MDEPVFKLEGVVKKRDETEDFEGPLILILQLLSKNKIEIQDIKISSLLEQYLAYLEEMKAMDLEIASEFVAMASHLVYIKTRMLISAGEERSELDELMSSLEKLQNRDVYSKVKTVTATLAEMYKRGAGMIVKPPEYMEAPEYSYQHEKEDIAGAILSVLMREEAEKVLVPERTVTMPKPMLYPVPEKSEEILKILRKGGTLSLKKLIAESASRTEIVAAFIAILELCVAGKITLTGECGDVEVSRSA